MGRVDGGILGAGMKWLISSSQLSEFDLRNEKLGAEFAVAIWRVWLRVRLGVDFAHAMFFTNLCGSRLDEGLSPSKKPP